MLQIEQPRHQSRVYGRPPGRRRKEPRPFPLEDLPVDQGGQLHQFVAQIDQVNQTRAEQVILFKRASAVLHSHAKIAGLSMKSYETLQAEVRKTFKI